MIEIHPVRESDKLIPLYKEAGIELNKNSIAVVAQDGEEILGNCLFDLTDEFFMLHSIKPKDDLYFADGLLRSALHVSAENNIMTAYYSKSAPIDLVNKLGFIKNAEKNELDIEKLFKSCESCGK